MSEEKKTVELNDEELEKVSGGYSASSELCKNCSQFQSIDSNGSHDYSNCKKYNKEVSACSIQLKAGFQAS